MDTRAYDALREAIILCSQDAPKLLGQLDTLLKALPQIEWYKVWALWERRQGPYAERRRRFISRCKSVDAAHKSAERYIQRIKIMGPLRGTLLQIEIVAVFKETLAEEIKF